ncbi:hypothetical protein IscW_ISCW012773 [Ixodes scapularis]|uniref:Neurotransmitter-gated ion-channel ligand-binding domain-containing protein n=1 Tax=Ixodes scapularis TaxID=6945 RepID=B7QBV3_IXOSC|nr:hypothetical protein IscW_ISCW012773 [Ixodes scapularis]|eukprot:XP_002413017.1 hypothetical protein IscW_ISCW012773 [Ixodes scapularis]
MMKKQAEHTLSELAIARMDMTYFPFDRHECVVEYTTIKDVEKQLNLSIFRPARVHPAQGSEFRLVSITSNR